MFNKYTKSTDTTKTLLVYLLLNGYDISKVVWAEEVEEERKFGVTVKKTYGITKDFIDVKRIEKEIEKIQCPIICSPLSYEYYSDAKTIYYYTPESTDRPLYINDLNIISKVMIITENCVVSSNLASKVDTQGCDTNGFMFFYDYVLKNECSVGKWHLTYKDNIFSIYYLSEHDNKTEELLLFSANEVDKTSTYKFAIYIIKKASESIDNWYSDNFAIEIYEMVGGDK